MAQIPFDALRTRLGRRVLAVLITGALLPAAVGSVVAYWRARDQLISQGQDRLRRSAKQLALSMYERLRQAEEQSPDWRDEELRATEVVPLAPGDLGPLDENERAHLASGRSLLRIRDADGPHADVLLIRGDPERPADLRALRIDEDFLWRTPEENLLEADDEFCVLEESGLLLHCSLPELASAPVGEGGFEAKISGRLMVGSTWSVFLRPAFASGEWRIVLAQPHDVVLAPVMSLRRGFPLLVTLALLLGLLLALPQIRRSLHPLRELTLGARRIAERDFEARVAIHSGDEFEVLGDAFNAMAAQLGRQFHTLEAMGEIDRSVLAALDLRDIARAVLEQLPRVAVAPPIGLIVRSTDETSHVRVFRPIGEGRVAASELDLDPAALEWIGSLDAEGELDRSSREALALREVLGCGDQRALVMPLRAQGRVLGALVLSRGAADSDAAALRGLVEQIAVAVWNARMIEEIRFYAYYDGLTGLANRQLGDERLRQALAQARRSQGQVAVLFLDLDRFKRVNDSMGHPAGDELLRVVSARLVETLRCTDTISRPAEEEGSVSRLGGDEFVILLPEVKDLNGAASAARRILEQLREPVSVQGREISVTASIGISMYPQDGDSPDELLRNADAAMYEAKRAGRDGFRFYREVMNAEAMHRLTLEERLRKALESQGLRVAYQPIVYLGDGRVEGVEALVRWTDPELGPVSSPELITVAEESGMIVALGEWILEAACGQAVAWEREGLPPLYVSVNASPRQITAPGFVQRVAEILRRSGLPAQRLVLEITETLLVAPAADPSRIMRELREQGVGLAIDDFGTSYSSLAYLKEFPLDFLKIDRCFVKEIGSSRRDEAIVAAIVELGHLLGLKVVAEGVETETQLAFLRQRGCDALQGYLFAHAVPADEIPDLVARIAGRAASGEPPVPRARDRT